MSRPLLAGVLPLLLALGACQTRSSAPPAPPITADQFPAIRAEYQRANPNARVGLVITVLPSANLASVGDVHINDFRVGDIITFVDSREQILTMGTVEGIEQASLDVRYQNPAQGSRPPAAGDLAVRAIPE